MIYTIIALILLAFELLYFRIAKQLQLIDDTENGNGKAHESAIRSGGIIFLAAVWIWGAFFGHSYPWFLTGASLIGLVSYIDDLHPLSIRLRLIVQFIAILLMFTQIGLFDLLPYSIDINGAIIIGAMIVGVGIINAFNFMDGINGITGGYSLAVLAPLIYLNTIYEFIDMSLLYVVGISLLIFCIFNFRGRARCFSGDVGSITIAFILLYAIVSLIIHTGDLTYLILIAVYGADSTLTLIKRIILLENVGTKHQRHLYQQLNIRKGFKQITIASGYALLQLIISATFIICIDWHLLCLLGWIVILGIGHFMAIRFCKHK